MSKVAKDYENCPEGFQELDLSLNFQGRRLAQTSADHDPDGLFLKLFAHTQTGALFGYARFGMTLEGPPTFVHGGAIAYVLDEAMGTAAWHSGKPVVAEQIEVKYLHLVPQNEFMQVDASILEVSKNKVVRVEATLKNLSGKVLSAATGRFHILDQKQLESFAKRMKMDLPAWMKKLTHSID